MGSSPMNLGERLTALDEQIQELCGEAGNAGLSIGVRQNGKTIYTSHFGYRNLRTKVPPNDDTIYHLGSLTKALVTAGLGVLVAEGKLEWETRLLDLDVEPRFHQRNKDVESQATLLDALAHRMGLAMRMNAWAQMQQDLLLPPQEAINVLGNLNKTADFRTTIKYNNWTYAMFVLLLEKITGKSVEEFMQETFFRPLGLKSTTFAIPPAHDLAEPHITLTDGTPFKVPSPCIGNGTLMCGAAGMKSSLHDLLRLYDSLLTAFNDQKKSGMNSTPGNPFKETGMLFTSHNKKGSTEYGLGWFLTELPSDIGWIGINDGRVRKNPVIGQGAPPTKILYHNGSMPGYLTSVHLIPESQTVIVILGNTLAFSDLPDYVGGLILNTILGAKDEVDFLSLVRECKETSIQGPLRTAAKLEAERKAGTSHKPLTHYEGRYINEIGNWTLVVRVSGSGLRMNLNDLPETYYDLHHYHDDVFAWDCDRDAEAKRAMFPHLSAEFRKIYFQSDEHGRIASIHWSYARDEPEGEVFVKSVLG
ncbi:putative D-aminoacylase [Nemania abortiva]|nr:putative D-aminoacylase [Nemania abortiva]